MSTHEQFLAEIDAFLAETRMAPTSLGLGALKDGKFVAEMRAGQRSPTLKTIDKVRAWMAENRQGAAA